MISPEKNFVDVSRLFNWGKEIEIKDYFDKTIEKLFIRIVSDEDLNKARVFSLRKSAELRRKLKTPETDERLAYIVDKELVDKDDIINMVLSLETAEIANKVVSEVDLPFPKEPKSDSTLEEQEVFQEEVDSWGLKRTSMISLEIQKILTQKRTEYTNAEFDKLYKMYENFVVNDLCQKEAVEQFKNFCLFSSCFKDENYEQRYFENPEEVTKIPRELKDQFLDGYNSLDISVDDLKK